MDGVKDPSKGLPLYGIVLLEPEVLRVPTEGHADSVARHQDHVLLVGACLVARVGHRLGHAGPNTVLGHAKSNRFRTICWLAMDRIPTLVDRLLVGVVIAMCAILVLWAISWDVRTTFNHVRPCWQPVYADNVC